MKKIITFFWFLWLSCSLAWAQQSGSIQGKIVDEAGEALIGATVIIQGTSKGAASDADGNFILKNLENGTYTLLVSYVGYSTQTISAKVTGGETSVGNITLSGETRLDQVVISGSLKSEKITQSPATIQVITHDDIEEIATFNPGELLSRVKGVDFIRSGVVGTGVNIRGFNSNFNSKNLQINDGRLATLIATGLPFGPLTTQIKEDIERVEVVLGPNSALYGPNAHNGLVYTLTKDPRTSEGTTLALGAGNQSMLTARLRHAQVLSDKFAFKVSGEYTRGEEFEYVDSVYIDRLDENGNLGSDGVVEAYEELELDRDFEFLRGEAALYYSVNDESDLVLSYGGSNSTYLAPTNVGRNQIIDWKVNHLHLKYTSPRFFAQVYRTWSKTDDTYSIDERTKQYYRGLDAGLSDEVARGEQSYASKAKFVDDSRRWNAEAQYNNTFGGFDVVVGAQWQKDLANSKGSYLLDGEGKEDIEIDQFGAYGQVQKKFGNSGFKAIAAFRADNHEIYDFNFVPKVGLLKIGKQGTWRLTYGQGIASPTIMNMFGDLFSGLILGNSEGFTLEDGTVIEKQKVEKIQTFELGYKGQPVTNKLYIDANVYYNISTDFLSPVTVIGKAVKRGNTPIEEVQSGYAALGGLVATYVNFGKVNTYGLDLGVNYYFNDEISATLNYSYFDYAVDEDNLEENDFNKDGVVNKLDVLVNSPTHKASLGLNYRGKKFFGNVFTRWVQAYDYFSSFQIAAKTQDLVYRGVPVVENARSKDAFNYGPLGGFVNVDIGAGYRINSLLTVSGQVSNLFDSEMREFTASPFIGRLYSMELKLKVPAIGSKK
ncbi:TonB-dependent receptor [Rapidithrix thailandica]|uniref:TonB-dependent receptor n=1 Tax=Rapidithrix thailandica TaxID=413964 RepID=A0AAW9S5Z6_9BACT